MRALGPGSVSSVLKIVLDVVSFSMWVLLAVLLLGAFLALILPMDLGVWSDLVRQAGPGVRQAQGPMLAAGLVAFAALAGVVQYILDRLRRIFQTLTAGDPFQPENVRRLRAIGFALAALEGFTYLFRVVVSWVFHDNAGAPKLSVDVTPAFAVLVVFVLAEVFREGARLRSEAELTI
jgi:hypothetical protein